MKRLTLCCMTTLAAIGFARAGAGEAAELRRLFPLEADVLVERDGLSRLLLPPGVIAACRSDLSDLRLFDREGREVAFLVDRGPVGGTTGELTQGFVPEVLDVERTEVGREHAPALRRERYDLRVPAKPPQSGSFTLVLETALPEFVARVHVEARGATGENVKLIEDGSLFRLGGPRAAQKLRADLRPFEGDRLRVVLETEGPSWLEPSFRLESTRSFERGGSLSVPLVVATTERREGRSVLILERPRGIVPDALRLQTATLAFDRRVEVWDEGAGSAAPALGAENLFRVEALVPVGDLEVALDPARGERLRVEIDDGDSPPLEAPSFAAVIPEPALVFVLPAGDAVRPAGTLRFGGGRARLPRYDLAGLLPHGGATGERARAAAVLHDTQALGAASLGSARPNPAYDGAPALAFAMRPGAAVERGVFSHVRELRVGTPREGLSRLSLDERDLALLAEDLADLRVADDSSRQWPYLIEPAAATKLVPLEVRGPDRRDGASRYELVAAVPRLRVQRIVLETETPFFDRGYRLDAFDDAGTQRTLATGRLVRSAGDPRPVGIEVPPTWLRSLELVVDDGDDAALDFERVQAEMRLSELYLTAPEGRYALLLGASDVQPARYDLERVREVVLALEAEPVEVGELRDNPDSSLRARLSGSGLRQRVLLWGALIAAVVVLGGLTLRLARR